jgi:hypothetical protein
VSAKVTVEADDAAGLCDGTSLNKADGLRYVGVIKYNEELGTLADNLLQQNSTKFVPFLECS